MGDWRLGLVDPGERTGGGQRPPPRLTEAHIRVGANEGFPATFAEPEAFAVTDRLPIAVIVCSTLNRY